MPPSREICKICWRPNAVGFLVPDDVWRSVVPAEFHERVVCLSCFARLGDEQLVPWDRQMEFYPVSMASHADFVNSAEAAPPEHPEATCGRCGGPNLMSWHAPSPLWNAVMRDEQGVDAFGGIVCPRCFGELAKAKGIAETFCLMTHAPLVELPSVSPDGRVWDAERCLWVDAGGAA